ncbi:MAG: DUF4185 domain-containing protein, partial [Elusimicrobiales bacterium]|nr:DUF4185 domain-containing protein [Elusimicrobiales bacterium]
CSRLAFYRSCAQFKNARCWCGRFLTHHWFGTHGNVFEERVNKNGQSLWLFGDTFYGNRNGDGSISIQANATNSAAVTFDKDLAEGVTSIHYLPDDNSPLSAIPYGISESTSELKLWPGHGVSVGERTYLFYSLVKVTGKGMWDFRHDGQGLATTADMVIPFTRLKHDGNYRFWNATQPRFGIAVLKSGDWLYIYGRGESKPYTLKLAKVRADSVEKLDKYRYFSGTQSDQPDWSAKPDNATTIFDGISAEASVSFNKYLGKYIMLYSRFFDKDVVVRLADNPWGPWSNCSIIYKCSTDKTDANCYAGKEHPQYAKQNGKIIYFTLVDNSTFGGTVKLYEASIEKQ